MGLRVDGAEIIETEYQRIEDRRADLVARMWGEEGRFILHIEIQNDNDQTMPWRMLRYRSEIGHSHPDADIRQYLIYIGKAELGMADGIRQTSLDYRYPIIDMHQIDCRELLAQDNPDALVLAILCNFKGRPAREVEHYILERLQQLTADNESRFREYLRMLEIHSTNRDLEKTIDEKEKMLSQVKYSDLPSYRIGMEQGIQQGIQQGEHAGEATVLARQLAKRFGPLSPATRARLNAATLYQLEHWAENILDAATLEEVFKDD